MKFSFGYQYYYKWTITKLSKRDREITTFYQKKDKSKTNKTVYGTNNIYITIHSKYLTDKGYF